MIKKGLLFLFCLVILSACEDLPELGIAGCTDSTYLNFNPIATFEDGSCSNCLYYLLYMYDSFGDGWNGATFKLVDIDDGDIAFETTLETGDFKKDSVCLPWAENCYEIIIDEGQFPNEISWVFYEVDSAGATVSPTGNYFGSAPFSGYIVGSDCQK